MLINDSMKQWPMTTPLNPMFPIDSHVFSKKNSNSSKRETI